MKSFINTQFGHCQLLLMFCSKRLYSFLNLIQKQAIFTVSNDKICTLEIFVTIIRYCLLLLNFDTIFETKIYIICKTLSLTKV